MSDEAWRVGILFSQTGITAAVERTMMNGTILAIEEINAGGGVNGRSIDYVIYDPEAMPKKYKDFARRLLTQDGVKTIFGGYMSSCRKAVLPEVEANRGLFFYPTVYEGFEYSPNCYYTGAASNQGAPQLVRFLMQHYGSRFLLVGSNYVFPYEYNRVMTDLVVQMNGSIADEIYVPMDPDREDFRKVMRAAARTEPDVIVCTVVGRGIGHLYEAFIEAGFDSAAMPIASVTTSEAEIAEMASGLTVGHLTSTPFFETLDTPAARRFVGAYKARFGAQAPVPACAEAAYMQVHLYCRALAAAGTDDSEEIARQMDGLEFDAPQGKVRIDPSNHHTELWPRIGRVGADDRFEVVWTSPQRVKPDPYFVSPSFDEWSMASDQRKP